MPHSNAHAGQGSEVAQAVPTIEKLIAGAEAPILDLSRAFIAMYDRYFDADGIDDEKLESLANSLEPQCLAVLSADQPRIIEGIGLVWLSREESSGMLWWRAEQGRIARKHHVFNPDSDSFYDYRNSVWFLNAYQRPGLSIVGPYIDSWGTDDHTLTASSAMRREEDAVGVAAADLNLDTVVAEVEKILAPLPHAVLVGDEDRVLASNIALLTPGLRLTPFLEKSSLHVITRHATVFESLQLVQLG